MPEIEIIHPGGERRIMEIEVIHHLYVSVRWGLSGIYNIDLKTGKMTATSAKARRKGDCLWKAVELEKLREIVKEHFNPNARIEERKRIEVHNATMPFSNPKSLIGSK